MQLYRAPMMIAALHDTGGLVPEGLEVVHVAHAVHDLLQAQLQQKRVARVECRQLLQLGICASGRSVHVTARIDEAPISLSMSVNSC